MFLHCRIWVRAQSHCWHSWESNKWLGGIFLKTRKRSPKWKLWWPQATSSSDSQTNSAESTTQVSWCRRIYAYKRTKCTDKHPQAQLLQALGRSYDCFPNNTGATRYPFLFAFLFSFTVILPMGILVYHSAAASVERHGFWLEHLSVPEQVLAASADECCTTMTHFPSLGHHVK